MVGRSNTAINLAAGRDCWASPRNWKHLAMQNWGGQALSLSQHGQSSAGAAPRIMDAQSSLRVSRVPSWLVLAPGTILLVDTPALAHAVAIGANTIATATIAETIERSRDKCGHL